MTVLGREMRVVRSHRRILLGCEEVREMKKRVHSKQRV